MVNKTSLSVKKCEANQKQHCKQVDMMRPKSLLLGKYISTVGSEATHNITHCSLLVQSFRWSMLQSIQYIDLQ